ncbi:unnamed protein product [Prorocentrum cordatum]|uniref:Uncharacterized protein n=1 Tax=Prorocentrum cordatum TaxID=2364126 RepID=A0ABN9XQT2_9DINO|nr:unnamed protein product [Polarella glacialis]
MVHALLWSMVSNLQERVPSHHQERRCLQGSQTVWRRDRASRVDGGIHESLYARTEHIDFDTLLEAIGQLNASKVATVRDIIPGRAEEGAALHRSSAELAAPAQVKDNVGQLRMRQDALSNRALRHKLPACRSSLLLILLLLILPCRFPPRRFPLRIPPSPSPHPAR